MRAFLPEEQILMMEPEDLGHHMLRYLNLRHAETDRFKGVPPEEQQAVAKRMIDQSPNNIAKWRGKPCSSCLAVMAIDISWGIFATAAASTAGLLIADWLTPRG
jgi:hypothetical protein